MIQEQDDVSKGTTILEKNLKNLEKLTFGRKKGHVPHHSKKE